MSTFFRSLKYVTIVAIGLLMAFISLGANGNASTDRANAQWNLTWDDGFNQSAIDTSHWSIMNGPSFYTPKSQETYSPANVQTQSDALALHTQGSNGAYTSAGVSSRGKYSLLGS
jgi:beta-glucanase (GH16 family)